MEFEVINEQGSGLNEVSPTVIKIIGCGGGGSSAVGRMIEAGVSDVQFIVLNTDLQALSKSPAQYKLAIGQKLTGGLGAGGNPAIGESAAKEDIDKIRNIIKGADMVIITAGMGGGTGTGSAPIVAQIAREEGALAIAVVTTPFDFEGSVRMAYAQDGIVKLKAQVDSLIVIPNEQVLMTCDDNVTFKQAFQMADSVLCNGVQGVSDIITKNGAINVDFADVCTVMKGKGEALLGVGHGEGENRAVDAASSAIKNPLLENRQIDGAKNILINITGPEDLRMQEVQEIVNEIKASASKNSHIFWGQVINPDMEGNVSVTVIATGFDTNVDKPQDSQVTENKTVELNENKNSDTYSTEEFNNLMSAKKIPSASPDVLFNPDDAGQQQDVNKAAFGSDSGNVPQSDINPKQYGSLKSRNYDPSDFSVPAFYLKRDGRSRTISFDRTKNS